MRSLVSALTTGAVIILTIGGALGLAGVHTSVGLAQDDGNVAPRCATVTARATWRGYGYTHIVTLANQCDRAVVCQVSTNVDPSPRHRLEAEPGASASVVTRAGSPGHSVEARYDCSWR